MPGINGVFRPEGNWLPKPAKPWWCPRPRRGRQRRRAAREDLGLPRRRHRRRPQKCEYVTRELGFDACVDYKAGNLYRDLQAACPKGADVYFDNVGGEILDTMLRLTNLFARIVVCGMIADYNATQPYAVKNLRFVLVNRIKMQGMIVYDWKERYGEGAEGARRVLRAGQAQVPRVDRRGPRRTRPRASSRCSAARTSASSCQAGLKARCRAT